MIIHKRNESFCFLECQDSDIHMKIYRNFEYYVDGYKFNPLYKMGKFDGKIKLYLFAKRLFPLGLIPQLKSFLDDLGVDYSEVGFEQKKEIKEEQLLKFIDTLNLSFPPRDYQVKLVLDAINSRKGIFVAATSSGKSLSQYILAMYSIYVLKKRVILIVPTTSLVSQMESDMKEYGISEDISVHTIMSGKAKIFDDDLIISTWQSLQKKDVQLELKETEFGMVITDEVHKAKSTVLKTIIQEVLTEIEYKIGVTGTLPKNQLDKQTLIGIFGEPQKIINAKDLVDRGLGTDLDITALYLKYTEADCKYVRKLRNYAKEVSYINEHVRKINFISKFAVSRAKLDHNSIVFFNRRNFGEAIFESIQELYDGKKVFYVDGSVPADVRESIRKDFENNTGIILVASTKTFSTGISIKRLNTGIFAENPGKSAITLIQSLGRFLRQHKSKEVSHIFDIVDDLRVGKYENYSFKHFLERIETYREESWEVKEKTFNL